MPERTNKTWVGSEQDGGAFAEVAKTAEGFDSDLPPGLIPGPGAIIDGKYLIERLIARGGMGAVFAASHVVSGKKVALKWMLPALGQIKGARERFIREARATARISHPNIVDIYDVGQERGSVYLVMEYLHGETLSDRLARGMSTHETVAMLMPVMRAVAAAHAQGVIHRDLKPDNIFVCFTESGEELEPKVLDFGISKIENAAELRDLALTHSGTVLGTPYYMPPEQVRGARHVDARADVYAFGVILYEALAGRRPYDADTYNELILKIATESAPRLVESAPGLDPGLISVIERAMAREPASRFETVEALGLALEPFANGVRFRNSRSGRMREDEAITPVATAVQAAAALPPPEAANDQVRTQAKPPRRWGRVAAVCSAVGICVALAGAYLWRSTHRSGPRLETAAPQASVDPKPINAAASPAPALEQRPGADGAHTAPSDRGSGASRDRVPDRAPGLAAEAVREAFPAPAAVAEDRAAARSERPLSAEDARGSTPAAARTGTRKSSQRATPAKPATRPLSTAAVAPANATEPEPPVAPREWDDRLSTEPNRNPENRAGKIDAHDFR